jgi:RHS repeat-associated protein
MFRIDWDGDGRTDMLANASGYWELYRSEGTTFAPGVPTGIPVGNGTWIVTDKDGDGLDDLAFANSAASYAINYGLHNGADTHPDLATSFTDGYGYTIKPSYKSPSFFGECSLSTYLPTFPDMNTCEPLQVVSQAVFTDPSNAPSGTYLIQYTFTNAVINRQGRGFEGYSSFYVSDGRDGRFTSNYYFNFFPYTGMLSSQFVEGGPGANYNNIFERQAGSTFLTLDATPNHRRDFPYFDGITDYLYEVTSTSSPPPITTTNTTYTYDSYGNATRISTTVTDNDSTSPYYNEAWTSTTVNTIAPNTGTWCLSLPTATTVTNSSTESTGTAITRTVDYVPDYTKCRQTQQVVEPASPTYKVTTVYGFDSFGNLNSQIVTGAGMAARTTTLNWGATGQFLTTVKDPLSQITTLGFDANNGMLASLKDPNLISTSWIYDNFARRMKEQRPDGTSTTWAYNSCATAGCVNTNNKMTVTKTVVNVGGSTQSVQNAYLDELDRILVTSSTMLNGSYDRNEVQYDNFGNVRLQAAPCTFVGCASYWTTNTYDVFNRLTESQRPISANNPTLQSTLYGYAGRTSTVQDALGHTSTKIAHVIGNLGRSLDPNGYYQEFTYDAFGSLLAVKDKPGNTLFTATYNYGVAAFQKSSTDMDLGARSYTIDALGEVTDYSDARSQPFSITYDALSRPLIRTEPDLTTTWNWGGDFNSHDVGKLHWVSAAGSAGTYTETYTYDGKGRPSTKTLSLPGDATYVYTATYNVTTGLLDTLQYPTSTSYQLKLQYSYANGILSSVADFNAPATIFWTANTTNPRGQVSRETFGNNVVSAHVYDAVTGWLSSIQAGPGGGASLQNNGFLFDTVGNVTQRQDSKQGLTENFFYDNMNRLDHSTLGGSTINLQMHYDITGMGNIASRSDVAAGAAWTYDSVRKHAVTQAGSSAFTYTYDANGNAMTRNGNTVTWTSYNYPNDINSSGESVQFWYGPERERWNTIYISSIGTETTYHGDKLLEKVVSGGTIDYRHYIYAGNELLGIYSRTSAGTNTMRYALADHQGSFTNIDTGTSPGTNYVNESFTPYGNRRNGETWSGAPTSADETAINAVSRRGYTGETALGVSMGLNHLNGRVGDAITGRVLSPDPYVPNPGNTQSFNRYSYVNNNPLSFTDPSGFDETGLPELIVTEGGGPENPYTDILAGAVEIASDLGLGSLLGFGGAPTLSPAQQAFVNHGGNLDAPLPQIQVTGVRLADNSIASQFYSRFSVSAMAATAGVDPDMIRHEHVWTTSSPSPDTEVDTIHVTADALHGFNWWNLAPGWSFAMCAYYGCGAGNWTLAAIGAIPFGNAESAVARGGLWAVRTGQAGEAAVRAAVDIGPKTAINIAGRTRIPDGLLSNTLSEVKNVGYLSHTQQLQDFAAYASQNGQGWLRLLRQISLQDKWICLGVNSDRLFILDLRQWS